MLITAIALMAIGSLGIGGAVVMEMKSHEPVWKLMMKIFPWFFGVGAILLAVSIAIGS
ncbi:hypothetical protein ES703_40927 [subsurface metagenome]